MADGLATAALLFLLPLALIAAGVAWWVHRPQRNEHETTSRIQPLFTSDLVVALDPEEDEEMVDEEAFDSERLPVASTKSSSDAANAPVSFAPPSAPRASAAAVRPAMPVRPIAPAPRHAAASRATSHSTSPLNASATSHPPSYPQAYPPSYPPSYPQAPAARAVEPAARIANSVQQAPSRPNLQQAWADGQAVRFNVPVDGTLQFLPGRLEIVSGQEPGREVRFVRLPDAPEPEITFGRNEGPMYRHVQLRDATVSRLHARIVLRGSAWTLTNLSTTNPVMLNGVVLGDGEAHVLADHDRVDMGEVVFRFRAR